MYTDEHIEHYADRYIRHGLRDCGVTLIQYLANPDRYASLESLLPRQRVAAGKALAEMAAPVDRAARAFMASLERARAEAHAAFDAALAATPIERVTIEPPVWCHACGAMLTYRGTLSGSTVAAECPECEARSEAALLRRTAVTLRGMP